MYEFVKLKIVHKNHRVQSLANRFHIPATQQIMGDPYSQLFVCFLYISMQYTVVRPALSQQILNTDLCFAVHLCKVDG